MLCSYVFIALCVLLVVPVARAVLLPPPSIAAAAFAKYRTNFDSTRIDERVHFTASALHGLPLPLESTPEDVDAALGSAITLQCSVDVPVQALIMFHPGWFNANVSLDVYLDDADTYRRVSLEIQPESSSNKFDTASLLGRHQHISQFTLDSPTILNGLHAMFYQAVVHVPSCALQVAMFLLTNADTDEEIANSQTFTIEVQQLKQEQQQQQQQQQQQHNQNAASCSCSPQHPWPDAKHMHHTIQADFGSDVSSSNLSHLNTSALFPQLTSFISGVFITPESDSTLSSVRDEHSACNVDEANVLTDYETVASEWEVYVTIKNNVGGGIRYLSPSHGSVHVAGVSSAVSGNWFCGRVKGGGFVKFRYPIGYESDSVWLTQSVTDSSDPMFRQCRLYKFVTSPLEHHRVLVPPAPGDVSRAFPSNGAWLIRLLDCSCSLNEQELRLTTTRDGSFTPADGVLTTRQQEDIRWALQSQLRNMALCRTDHSLAFASCSQQSRCHHSSIPQPDAPLEVDTEVTPPLASSPQFEDLDVVFGRHLPLADSIRVAVLLTGTLRNFLTLKRIKAFNSQVVDALGGASVVDVFAVIGRSKNGGNSDSSSGSPASDCASLRASVSAVRVCLELDPPVSDRDDLHIYPASLSPLSAPPAYFSRSPRSASGWRTFPGLPFGQPPGYYQWQKVVTAANMAFRSEIFESQRYSYFLRVRTDGVFTGSFPGVINWPDMGLQRSRAYARKFGDPASGDGCFLQDQVFLLGADKARDFVNALSYVAMMPIGQHLAGIQRFCGVKGSQTVGVHSVCSECMINWLLHTIYGENEVFNFPAAFPTWSKPTQ